MDISKLSEANEIYNQVRGYQGKLAHLKSRGILVRVEVPSHGHSDTRNSEYILIHEFDEKDTTHIEVVSTLINHYENKIKELKEVVSN